MLVLVLALVLHVCALKPELLPGLKPLPPKTTEIAAGERFIVTESTEVGVLLVHGTLVVHPSKDLTLKAAMIVVMTGGALYIGTEESPVTGNVVVEMVGERMPMVSPHGTGHKSIGVMPGGLLRMHGKPIGLTWTVLAAPAAAGAREIAVKGNVADWSVGARILISTTDFESDADENHLPSQTETRTIKAIAAQGADSLLTLDRPLNFSHYAESYKPAADAPASHTIEMRAAVGLLTRNLVFHGNNTASEWGAHMIFLEKSDFDVRHVELHSVGQAMELGRYPLHAHLAGATTGKLVGNSIHDTFQRCITIHGTKRMLVADNVCFRSKGHGVFIEDGNEEQNIVSHNLVVSPQKHKLLGSDTEPSCFWITNSANHFYDNTAVGCKFGFWFAMPSRPLGFAKAVVWLLRYQPAGDFIGNEAVASETGVFVDRGQEDDQGNARELSSYRPRDFSTAIEFADMSRLTTLSEYERQMMGIPTLAVFSRMRLWKNGEGFWYRGDFALVTSSQFADNAVACTMPGNDNVLQDSVVVGESNNVGTTKCDTCPPWSPSNKVGDRSRPTLWWPSRPILGFRTYDAGGGDLCIGVTFYNFVDYRFALEDNKELRSSGAISGLTGPNVIEPNTIIVNSKFVNVQNRVFLTRFVPRWDAVLQKLFYDDLRESDDALKAWAVVDYDGSITGQCGATVVGTSPHVNSGCVERPGWNAWVCEKRTLRPLYISSDDEVRDAVPNAKLDSMGHLTNVRSAVAVDIEANRKNEYKEGSAAYETYQLNFGTNIVTNEVYSFSFGRRNEPFKTSFAVQVGMLTVGEVVRIAFPFAAGSTFSVKIGYGEETAPAASSIATLSPSTPWIVADGLLWLHFETRGREWVYRADSAHYPQLTTYSRLVVTPMTVPTASLATFDLVGRAKAAAGAPLGVLNEAQQCGKNGPSPLNGAVRYARVGADETFIISDGKWSAKYAVWSKQCNESLASSEPAILCDWTGKDRWSGGGAKSWEEKFAFDNPSGFTHLLIRARSAPGFGRTNFGVQVIAVGADEAKGVKEKGGAFVMVASPLHHADGPLVETEFRDFFIPVGDMDFSAAFTTISGFALASSAVRPLKIFVSQFKFVKATRSVVPVPSFPALIAVPPRRSSFDPKAGVGSSDPGGVPSKMCVPGSPGCNCGAAGCAGALVCVGGFCVHACARSRALGCGCTAGQACADGLSCSPNQVCFDASKGCGSDGVAGCKCAAGNTCTDASLTCADNVCRIASCAPGELACSCKTDGTCASGSACETASFCVVKGETQSTSAGVGATVPWMLLLGGVLLSLER
jgi:hypothetical protein